MSKYQNLSVPFNIPIPGGMSPGKMVVLQGNIPSMSQRFAVNLLTRSGDIALHVSPKFSENRVIRNNVLNMNWGPEESHGSMPVFPGQSFEIMILCESYSFKVSFNGRHFCDFSHRLPYNSISNLAVDGEVNVHNVNFKDPSGYGNNNNLSYGFDGDASKHSSGGLYPTIDSYPYPSAPNSNRSPSPIGGFKIPSSSPQYPSPHAPQNPNGLGYPSSGGGSYPTNPSYPTQPSYPSIPHQGPYPQVPNSSSGGGSHSKSGSGFLDQAGAALAGVLGPAILAGGMQRLAGHGHGGHGKPNLLDEAGRALAGVMGGGGLAGAGRNERETQPRSPTSGSAFLDHAGSALAGILGGAGLAGAANRSLRGLTPPPPSRPTQPGNILDQAGSALAGILGGSGLSGTSARSLRGYTPPPSSTRHGHPGNILDQAGSALAGILGGGGLSGTSGRPLRGFTPPPTRRPAQSDNILDQAGSALAGLLGNSDLSGSTGRSIRGSTPPPPTRQTQSASNLDQAGSALTGALGGGGLTGGGVCRFLASLGDRTQVQPRRGHGKPEFWTKRDWTCWTFSVVAGLTITVTTTAHHKHSKKGILGGALGTAVAGAALTGHLNPIKATKKQLKAHKKALKYGLPLAGAGLGAYALHKGLKKGFKRSSSSSSCSSGSWSD